MKNVLGDYGSDSESGADDEEAQNADLESRRAASRKLGLTLLGDYSDDDGPEREQAIEEDVEEVNSTPQHDADEVSALLQNETIQAALVMDFAEEALSGE